MGLVGKVGRRRPRARLALAILYLVLSLGAITTLYPFFLMVSTGFKGPTDQNDNVLIPKYFKDDTELETRYLDDKYAGDKAQIASTRIGPKANQETLAEYEQFLMGLPLDMWTAGFRTPGNGVTSRLTERYRNYLKSRFANIDQLNQAYVEENVGFQTVVPPNELFDRASWRPNEGRKWTDWLEFKGQLPAEFRIPVRLERMWQLHLAGKFQNQFDQVPNLFKGTAKKFEEIRYAPIPDSHEYEDFRFAKIPARYREGAAESLWAKISPDPLPIVAFEQATLAKNATSIKREFMGRNYRYVVDYMALNGRAVLVTATFCLLAILTQLTVNPLAAFALSRFPIKASGKILIFLLATMAFPAEVAMIPSFLLLKQFGLLNTFAALVLPTAASGYMIFLLKGFFDSLPQELYESGQLDGAKETTMLWKIALPLSRPVLGYLALLAFMGAYGAFMYAFLVAQDQKMWTIMVWIYQLQMIAPRAVTMAALTLAALPTLIVFLFAQKVIMRGIVLPGER